MSELPPVPELQRRLVFVLLRPVMAICRRLRVPLDMLEELCRLAYYEELRRRGSATQAEVAEVFGTSLRTVVGVGRGYRGAFLAPEYEVELSRRIEEALTERAATADALAGRLNVELKETRRALMGLVAAGRVAMVDGEGDDATYGYVEKHPSLVRADLLTRLDGLRHQLEVLGTAVERRFLDDRDPRPSMARTVSFLGGPEEVEALADELVRTLRLRAIDVEERALRQGGHDRYGLTMALAATDTGER